MIQLRRDPEGDERGDGRFAPGTLVHHRKYGYRGVVVDADPECLADAAWYQSNQSQPRRDQPWYHVLVHGGAHSTYVAQENLILDTSGEALAHPLLTRYFDDFEDGSYRRNDVPFGA